jgi:hypothetical protein
MVRREGPANSMKRPQPAAVHSGKSDAAAHTLSNSCSYKGFRLTRGRVPRTTGAKIGSFGHILVPTAVLWLTNGMALTVCRATFIEILSRQSFACRALTAPEGLTQ